jgi:predicted alpha/beta-fold hydrolase
LANQLGAEGDKTKVDGAILFAVPWDQYNSHHYAFAFRWGMYAWLVGLNFNRLIAAQIKQLEPFVTKEEFTKYNNVVQKNWDGVRLLETEIFAPMFGYEDRLAYYKDASTVNRLERIAVPVFAIHSRDDWVCLDAYTPMDVFQRKGSNILVGLTNNGTHACHLTGNFFPGQFYPRPLVSFLVHLQKGK